MMGAWLLWAALVCPEPKIINQSVFKWGPYDQKTFERAKVRCQELYPQSPCLKVFIKTSEGNYRVICGSKS